MNPCVEGLLFERIGVYFPANDSSISNLQVFLALNCMRLICKTFMESNNNLIVKHKI